MICHSIHIKQTDLSKNKYINKITEKALPTIGKAQIIIGNQLSKWIDTHVRHSILRHFKNIFLGGEDYRPMYGRLYGTLSSHSKTCCILENSSSYYTATII